MAYEFIRCPERGFWVLAAYLLTGAQSAAGHPVPQELVTYVSPSGFELKYPKSWIRLRDGRNDFLIVNGSARVEGAVIAHGEAAIAVRPIPQSDAIYKMLQEGTVPPGVEVVERSSWDPPQALGAACTRTTIIAVIERDAPRRDAMKTTYFTCSNSKLNVEVALIQWLSDRSLEGPLRIARGLIASIKPYSER